jgi:CrcB protein
MTLLLVGAGGFFGADSRYLLDGWISNLTRGAFPWGTFMVNVTGSFALGLLFALSVERAVLPSTIRPPILIGFVGAYTTFSTLTLESWRLIEDGSYALAFVNIGGSMLLGMVAVVAGLALGRAL